MNYSFLSNTILFRGIYPKEIKTMLDCLQAESRSYQKGEDVYRAGDVITAMGLILSGSVNIENHDIWGNKSILDHVGPGQIFAETYACIPGESLMVNVTAAEEVEILFLNTARLLQNCPQTCTHHSKLIYNLLTVTAQKNLTLSRRIFHTSSKTIRGRLLSYLSFQALQEGSYRFRIPFSRQQLADYLGVDRSAMSNELSKMRKEGLLDFDHNLFYLKENFPDT